MKSSKHELLRIYKNRKEHLERNIEMLTKRLVKINNAIKRLERKDAKN